MVDFEIAKTWHKLFVDRLELTIEGIIDEPLLMDQVSDGSSCKLGKWLDGPARALGAFAEYAELKEAHGRFHQCAVESIAAWKSEPDRGIKAETIDRIRAASKTVLERIDHLAARFESNRENVSYVSLFEGGKKSKDGSWDDSLLVGVATIDEQHKAIIDILDLLLDPGTSVRSEAAMDGIAELGNILQSHFFVEEAYLRKGAMPAQEVKAHCKEHKDILDEYSMLYASLTTDQSVLISNLANRVRSWAIDHVVTYDIDIRKYLH